MKRSALVLVVAMGLLVAACGDAGTEADSATSTPNTTSTTIRSTTTTETSMPIDSDLAESAVADLAARLGVSEGDVEVLRVESVAWPDASLGCPEEGQMYAQVIVEGHRIILGHDERVYIYHSGEGQPSFLCPSEERDGGYDFVPPPGAGES
jgi:hypothetical protein